jgi:hypothetical protein
MEDMLENVTWGIANGHTDPYWGTLNPDGQPSFFGVTTGDPMIGVYEIYIAYFMLEPLLRNDLTVGLVG